ncbi:MAG: hypothetical protein IH934_06940 [Nanoarchaeota archaeon]|nr:hypothetical protein [Nanoarchaeota archaeon]
MTDKDFVVERKDLDLNEHVIVKYRFQTPGDFLNAAIALSKEQSFSCIEDPIKEKLLIRRFAAKVIKDSIVKIQQDNKPALPTYIYSKDDGPFFTREVELAFPIELFGDSLILLLDTVIGEIHNIAKFTGIKILDIQFPKRLEKKYGGPAFGIEGIRKIVGKEKGPILISPVKPCVGLSPDEFAERVYHCLIGGFDGVKDDELLLDPPYCPFEERVVKTVKAVQKAEKETGKKRLYFAHVGGDINDIDRFVKFALDNGVSGIMFSPLVNGLDIIRKYKGKVPIISHNNLSYGFSRHPLIGVSFSLYVKIQRLCGADMIICPAPDRSFYVMDYETHRSNVNACISGSVMRKTLAGFSGSQTPETLYSHYQFLGHDNFAICPGSAVYEHPNGIEAGARSFVEAVEALSKGVSIFEYAKNHEDLRVSLESFKNETNQSSESKNNNLDKAQVVSIPNKV